MRFGLVHRVMTDALAALGLVAIALGTGVVPLDTAILLVVLFAGATAVPDRWRHAPLARRAVWVLPTIGAIGLAVAVVAGGHSIVSALVEGLAGIAVVRAATRRGAEADATLFVVALVGFVAGSVLGGGLACTLCLVGAAIVAPAALVLSLLRREVEGNYRQGARDRTGHPVDVPRILRSRRVVDRRFLGATLLLGAPLVLAAGVFFVLLPRFEPLVGVRVDRIDLGLGPSAPSDVVALRFTVEGLDVPPPRLPLRLRGAVLDRYDGRTWQESTDVAATTLAGGIVRRAPSAADRRITIEREPLGAAIVLVPEGTIAVTAPFALARTSNNELRGGGDGAARYEAIVGRDAPAAEALPDPARFEALPSAVPPRVLELGRRWSDGATSAADVARALERRLKTDFAYDLASPSRGSASPLEHFLFESRRAHCELFATAMALMLRDRAIPSRVVTGFLGGTYNRYGGYYVVREREAHAWVEAWVDGAWRTYDPTPSAAPEPLDDGALTAARELADASSRRFANDVLRYGAPQRARLIGEIPRVRDLVLGVVIAGGLVLGARVLVRRRRTGALDGAGAARDTPALPSPAADLYQDLEEALHTHGITRDPALPPLAHAEALAAQRHPLAGEVLALTQVYLAARFGGVTLSRADRRDFARRVRGLTTP